MAKQFYSLLTSYGSQQLANALTNRTPLDINTMAVGDGNGTATTPDANKTSLAREVYRANISAISLDPRNNKQIIFELTIPENVGGFYIREMGIFDSQNKLIAYANCPDSFKPSLESGSGKVQVLRMILLVNSSEAVTLKVDNSVIFATKGQLTPKQINANTNNAVDDNGHTHAIAQASTSEKGIVQLTNDTGLDSENLGLTAKAGKVLAQGIATLRLALNNYIPNSKKSDSTTSNSSDTVATSKAVKDVRDIAESKQSPATTLAGYGISDFKVGMIATDESINDYTTPGLYYFERRGSKSGEPYIYSDGMSLEVMALSNSNLVQRLYSSNSRSGYQERNYINGKWSSWSTVKAMLDNNSASDVNYSTTLGTYFIYKNINNSPDKQAEWVLDVRSYNGKVRQIARKLGSLETYERYRADNTWSEWKRTDGVDWSDVREAPTTLSGYGITNFKVEQSTSNADNFKTDGQYYFANGQNLPDNGAWHIEVVSGGEANAVRQIAHKTNDTKIKTRFFNGSSWSSWKDAGGDGMPVGAVVAFPKEITNPQGFLLANGTTFSQQTYPDLYRTLGNKNKLPNLQRSDVGMTAYFAVDNIPDGWIPFDNIRTTVTQQNYPELYQHLMTKYGSISSVPLAEDRFIRGAHGNLAVGQTQNDEIKAHTHKLISYYGRHNENTALYGEGFEFEPQTNSSTVDSWGDGTANDNGWIKPTNTSKYATGGAETRPKAIAFKLCIKAKNSFDDVRFWIKAFGEVTNVGELDAGRLAQDIQQVRAEKADLNHTHTYSQITDFEQGVLRYLNQGFTQNLSETGWTKLPNGLILQWGKAQHEAITTFPIAFPVRCVAVSLCQIVSSYSYDAAIYNYSRTNFKAYIQRGTALYMAIGF